MAAGLPLSLLLTLASLSHVAVAVKFRDRSREPLRAPGVAPLQFLIISSPTYQKVAWTTLENFASADGKAFPLVDTGLLEPKGIALDRNNGHLYIADAGAKAIYQYTVLPVLGGGKATLSTTGVRIKILEGHPVESVTVDDDGNLFYTAPANHTLDQNNINKISAATIEKINMGEIRPSALQIVSEKTLEAKSMLEAKNNPVSVSVEDRYGAPWDKQPEPPHIYSMYEATVNSHVFVPAAITADGADLYWTNAQNGKEAGTVVKGLVAPKSQPSTHGPLPFPATALTNVSDGAFGLAKTHRNLFFSRNGAAPNTGLISGVVEGSDVVIDITTQLAKPRGLVWDKDETVYVADEDVGVVWSFPAGRVRAKMPLTKTVHMDGAYGLVTFSQDDPAWAANQRNVGGQTVSLAQSAQMNLNEVESAFFMETGNHYSLRSGKPRYSYHGLGVVINTFIVVLSLGCCCCLCYLCGDREFKGIFKKQKKPGYPRGYNNDDAYAPWAMAEPVGPIALHSPVAA